MHSLVIKFDHPRVWLETIPEKIWIRQERRWDFSPRHIEPLSNMYRDYLRSVLVSHALRHITRADGPENISVENLTHTLRTDAVAAGRIVGVRFSPGHSNPRHIFDGDLSSDWLTKAARQSVEFALEVWDRDLAERRHRQAVKGGRTAVLRNPITAEMVEALVAQGYSTARIARRLGCSPRHVSYKKAELKRAAA